MATVRYRLHTPASYVLLMALLLGLSAFAAYAFYRAGLGGSRGVVVMAVAFGAPLLALLATGPYRAWPGGHVTFTDDAVEVQRGRSPVRFARTDGIQVEAQQINVRLTFALIPVAELDRGQLVTIGSGSRAAKFSTLLVALDDRPALLLDLARATRGEPARGFEAPPAAPRTVEDDRLDAELRDAD